MLNAAQARPDKTFLYVRGTQLVPLAQGALWWPSEATLIVSDLHLEKGSSYARRGQLLPPYDTSSTLALVEGLAATLKPRTIISLGDSFHDRTSEERLSEGDRLRIRALTAAHDWIWVEGNHDPDPPAHLGGRAAKVFRRGDLVFRHEPEGEAGEIAGHLHPVARIGQKGRTLRVKCFVSDGSRLILPSMGRLTGGLNVLDTAISGLFAEGMYVCAVSAGSVRSVPRRRLHPDVRSTGGWRL